MKSKRRKPNMETLDQFIYDHGFEEAMEYFQLTEKQVENILFSPVIDRRMRKKTEIDNILEIIIDVDLEEAFPVYLAIRDNYYSLKKRYIWNSDVNKVNVRSESLEDKFHNALIRIMTDLSRFEYVDDKSTLEYVRSRLFFQNRADKKQNRSGKGKNLFHNLRNSEYVEQLINNLCYEEN